MATNAGSIVSNSGIDGISIGVLKRAASVAHKRRDVERQRLMRHARKRWRASVTARSMAQQCVSGGCFIARISAGIAA